MIGAKLSSKTLGRIGGALLALLLPAAAATAQGKLSPTSFGEQFPAQPSAARGDAPLAGLSLGVSPPRLPLDLRLLRLPLGDPAAGPNLCLSLRTEDGAYAATAVFPGTGVYREPPQLALRTRHAAALRQSYRGPQLVALARRATSCDAPPAESVYTPVIALGGAPALVASIVADPSAEVSAWVARGAPGKVGRRMTPPQPCQSRPTAVRSHICSVPVKGLRSGRYVLSVEIGGGTPETFAIALP
ncbi:MAG: hypothetical protein AAFW46_02600 [Pseudomonadota bacterium]